MAKVRRSSRERWTWDEGSKVRTWEHHGRGSCPLLTKSHITCSFLVLGCKFLSAPHLRASVCQLCLCSWVWWWAGTQRKRNNVPVAWGGSIYLEDCIQDCRSLLARSEWDPTGLGVKGRSKSCWGICQETWARQIWGLIPALFLLTWVTPANYSDALNLWKPLQWTHNTPVSLLWKLNDTVQHWIYIAAIPWWLECRNCLECRRCRFDLWVRNIPWRRAWQRTPVSLPGKSHGQRSLAATVHGVTKSQTWLSTRHIISIIIHARKYGKVKRQKFK